MTDLDPHGRRDPAHNAGTVGILATASAVVLSIVSLSVAISANRTQERLLAASVWPTLEFGTGNRGDDGSDVVSLTIGNSGIGPARIRSFQVFFEGEATPDSVALLRRCCELGKGKLTTITSSTRARVLKAGENVEFMRLPRANNDDALWERLNLQRFNVQVKACYCSVLDDCWTLDTETVEPVAIEACPVLPAAEQWDG